MCPEPGLSDVDVDVDAIVATLEAYPVQFAVLYGSHAQGVATSDSDIDIAVAFPESLSESARFDCRLDLVVDLMEALGTDDVDVTDFDTVRPEVGLQAVETGQILIGDRETRKAYREQFERDAPSVGTHEERMRKFDAVLRRLDETI